MKIAFHIWGSRVSEFAKTVDVRKAIFYTDVVRTPVGKDEIGVFVTGDPPTIKKPCGIQYKSNICTVPQGFLYNIHYGDIRKLCRGRSIPIVCDIMDMNFWYYYTSLKPFGLFTFSVDSSICKPDVYKSTIQLLMKESEVVTYGQLCG